jgi:hypothetical protein
MPERFCLADSISRSTSRSVRYSRPRLPTVTFTEVGAALWTDDFSMEIALPPIRTVTNLFRGVTEPKASLKEAARAQPTDSSSCARFNPARPLLELLIGSLSIRRSAAATRSRARPKSAMVLPAASWGDSRRFLKVTSVPPVQGTSGRADEHHSRRNDVYCRGSGRMRFFRGRFTALPERMSCFPVAIVLLRLPSQHSRSGPPSVP